jgi:hypothetical protein
LVAAVVTNGPITVYNRYIDPSTRGELYSRSVVPAAFWSNNKAAHILATGGLQNADAATIFIPLSACQNYLDWTEWRDLVNKRGKWTLHPGDLVVHGSVTDVIGTGTGEISVSDLRRKYDVHALAITTIDGKDDVGTSAMRHFKVGAA